MNELRETAKVLMTKVVRDPAVETAWLSALARMEEVAARQIRTNISAFTPEEEKESILEHAADEERHARMILAMKTESKLPGVRYSDLESRLCQIAEHFVVGYFGNPLLITAKNKHAAYAHGAVTIEQFPFQVYTAYLKETQMTSVKENLPSVIRDEQSHIQLGKRLLEKLTPAERLSIERLQEIEEDMCLRMMRRMDRVLEDFYGAGADAVVGDSEAKSRSSSAAATSLESCVSASLPSTIAWTYTLGFAEKLAASHMQKIFELRSLALPSIMPDHVADELRHSKMLQRTVLLERRRLSRNEAYARMEQGMMRAMKRYQLRLFSSIMKRTSDPDLIYYYGALALETRVFRHYKQLSQEVDHIGVSHVLGAVLADELEHTRQVSGALKEAAGADTDEYREISKIENQAWQEMSDRARALIEGVAV